MGTYLSIHLASHYQRIVNGADGSLGSRHWNLWVRMALYSALYGIIPIVTAKEVVHLVGETGLVVHNISPVAWLQEDKKSWVEVSSGILCIVNIVTLRQVRVTTSFSKHAPLAVWSSGGKDCHSPVVSCCASCHCCRVSSPTPASYAHLWSVLLCCFPALGRLCVLALRTEGRVELTSFLVP